MADNVEPLFKAPNIFGPERTGHDVIWDGRLVPNITARERGDQIEFTLDGRLVWTFPREWAFHALDFAANAMAFGAGYPCFTADKKVEAFAPSVSMFGGDSHG